MPRNNKSTKQVEPVVSSQSIKVPEVVEVSLEPVVEKEPKTKKPRAPKSSSVKTETLEVKLETSESVKPSPVVAPLTLDEPHHEPEVDAPVNEQSVEFISKLNALGLLISSVKSDYRNLEKKWMRELKVALKLSSKRKRKSVNRAPSGFVKPTRISDELAAFLEKPTGSEMARTEVTRDINKYIRTNNLQDKDNGRKINPDSKLATLLKLNTSTDELTYFNLQRYMSPHFAKASKEVVTASG